MEYANPSSFERLTGKALFTPTGQAGAIDLGNIEMHKLDYGPKSVEIPKASRGKLTLARRDTFQTVPAFSIDGDQFATPIIPLILLGDQIGDLSISSGTGSTFTFTAAKGLSFWVGAYNISNVSVAVASVGKTLNTDYFLDAYNGIISLPVLPAGIADAATVVVTFDKPAITMEQYNAFTKLNRQGTLVVYAEDEYGPPAKEIWTMTSVQLSVKSGPERTGEKFSKFTLEASIIGDPLTSITVAKRKS
jgi:hypothetical protein